MTAERYLTINGDDFGRSPGINRGIIEAHVHGIVTSASLMVRRSAALVASAYSRDHPDLSLGLRLDLGEWAYRDDAWVALYYVVSLNDKTAVTEEVSRELAKPSFQ